MQLVHQQKDILFYDLMSLMKLTTVFLLRRNEALVRNFGIPGNVLGEVQWFSTQISDNTFGVTPKSIDKDNIMKIVVILHTFGDFTKART